MWTPQDTFSHMIKDYGDRQMVLLSHILTVSLHKGFLTTSFSQRLSHNVFLITSFSQRFFLKTSFSQHFFLTTSFSQRFYLTVSFS